MRISFKRSGGFAGLTLAADLDTASLPLNEAHKVQRMVEEAGFFDLPASIPAPAQGADAFQYVVTVEDEGKRHTVRTNDLTVPDALWPLLEYLTKTARTKKGG
jgi:hypothetical protein